MDSDPVNTIHDGHAAHAARLSTPRSATCWLPKASIVFVATWGLSGVPNKASRSSPNLQIKNRIGVSQPGRRGDSVPARSARAPYAVSGTLKDVTQSHCSSSRRLVSLVSHAIDVPTLPAMQLSCKGSHLTDRSVLIMLHLLSWSAQSN